MKPFAKKSRWERVVSEVGKASEVLGSNLRQNSTKTTKALRKPARAAQKNLPAAASSPALRSGMTATATAAGLTFGSAALSAWRRRARRADEHRAA